MNGDPVLRFIFEMELANALARGDGTECQRHEVRQALYKSKLERRRRP